MKAFAMYNRLHERALQSREAIGYVVGTNDKCPRCGECGDFIERGYSYVHDYRSWWQCPDCATTWEESPVFNTFEIHQFPVINCLEVVWDYDSIYDIFHQVHDCITPPVIPQA